MHRQLMHFVAVCTYICSCMRPKHDFPPPVMPPKDDMCKMPCV